MFKRSNIISLLAAFLAGLCMPVSVMAVSFTADAVQIRNGEFNHARIFWTDKQVRFEYLDQGVSMVQIYDSINKKIIWLDTENKVFLERELSDNLVKQKIINKSAVIKNPCDALTDAVCTKLKSATVNERETTKWLITLDYEGNDQHVFQWLDNKYGVVIKQTNPDGTQMMTKIEENLDVNGRKARKINMISVSQNETPLQNIQWYDNELDIVIRQVFADGAIDELRNLKVEKLEKSLFGIPKGYSEVEQSLTEPEPELETEAFKFVEAQTN